jgi:hypothetical protein
MNEMEVKEENKTSAKKLLDIINENKLPEDVELQKTPLTRVAAENIVEEAKVSSVVSPEKAAQTFTEILNQKIKQAIDFIGLTMTKENPLKKQDMENPDPEIDKYNDKTMNMITEKINYWVGRILSAASPRQALKQADEIIGFWFNRAKPYLIEELKKQQELKAKEEDEKLKEGLVKQEVEEKVEQAEEQKE